MPADAQRVGRVDRHQRAADAVEDPALRRQAVELGQAGRQRAEFRRDGAAGPGLLRTGGRARCSTMSPLSRTAAQASAASALLQLPGSIKGTVRNGSQWCPNFEARAFRAVVGAG